MPALSDLPKLNAILNGTSAVLIILGYVLIRRRRIVAHVVCMVGAVLVSTAFLTSYLYYHFHHPTTPYPLDDWTRPVYLTILFSHIVLAVAVVPLVLITVYRAVTRQWQRHVRIAYWTLPIWLYVSVTGVVVYLFLAPHYAR